MPAPFGVLACSRTEAGRTLAFGSHPRFGEHATLAASLPKPGDTRFARIPISASLAYAPLMGAVL
jgi:hypothetical protein